MKITFESQRKISKVKGFLGYKTKDYDKNRKRSINISNKSTGRK